MSSHFIHMQREPSEEDYTYGKYSFYEVSGLTIEDEYREEKVPDETRLPADTFEILLRTEGGMHKRYSQDDRFKDFHRGMLWLQGTEKYDFTYCYIHVGVTDDHTSGCIITGRTKIEYKGQPGVGHSSAAYEQLYKRILPYLLAGSAGSGDRVFITIKDHPDDHT